MKWSFRFARVFGIDLKVHVTFLLIILWGAMSFAGAPGVRPLIGVGFGILLVLLLFACVTLHELGHSVVAIRFGVPVREIILLPIGGVAMLSRSPTKPMHELLIAIAGPAVNVVILLVLLALRLVLPQLGLITPGMLAHSAPVPSLNLLLGFLVSMNVALILFNLIPAFPLDGGRVLRALLWMRMPMARATRIAGGLGQVFAVILGLIGLARGSEGIWLTIIALFIFLGAGAETAAAQSGTILATRRVGDAYNKFALSLSIDDRVSRVIDYILTSYQPDFAVMHRGKFQGVVTRDDVLKWLSQNDYDVYVTEIMHEDALRVDARLTLEEVLHRMQEAGRRVAAVFDGDAYLGLVSAEDIAEAQLVLTFLSRGPTAGPATSRRIRPGPATTEEPVV